MSSWTCTFGCSKRFDSQYAQERHLGVHNEDERIHYSVSVGQTFTIVSTSEGYICPNPACSFHGYGVALNEHLSTCLWKMIQHASKKRQTRTSDPDESDVSEPAQKKLKITRAPSLDDFDDFDVTDTPTPSLPSSRTPAVLSSSPPLPMNAKKHSLTFLHRPLVQPPEDNTFPTTSDVFGPSPSGLPSITTFSGITANPADITQDAMLDFLATELKAIRGLCVYHTVMRRPIHLAHSTLYPACEGGLRTAFGGSEFEQFRKGMSFRTPCCFSCGTPHWTAFAHGQDMGRNCQQGEWLGEWLRGVAYLVWRTEALRRPVFLGLGIPPDAFATVSSYRDWLGRQCIPGNKFLFVSNLIAVVWAFMFLNAAGSISGEGFEMDD